MPKRSNEEWAATHIARLPKDPPKDFSATVGEGPKPTENVGHYMFDPRTDVGTFGDNDDEAAFNSGAAWFVPRDPRARAFFEHRGHMRQERDSITGATITVKAPGVAQIGDTGEPFPDGEAARSIKVVRHDGNIVHHTLSNSTPHIPQPGNPYRAYQIAIARAWGWFPAYGCVIRHVKSGWMDADHLVATELHAAKVCKPGTFEHVMCPHSKIERDARLARHAAEQAVIAKAFEAADPSTKIAIAVAEALDARDKAKAR